MSLFYGYVRASTTDQLLTLDAQRLQLGAWGNAFGHQVEIHVESGVSGSVAPQERPILGSLLRSLDAGKAQGLVAVKLDRLSRSTRDVIDLIERAEKQGWALVSKNESLDTSSAMGRFVVRLMGSLAELERELIGERTSAALGQLKREGRRYSRFVPWGFTANEDGTLVVNEKEQAIVASLRHYEDLGLPAAAALRFLREKHGTHPRTGKPFTASSVRNIRRAVERAGVTV